MATFIFIAGHLAPPRDVQTLVCVRSARISVEVDRFPHDDPGTPPDLEVNGCYVLAENAEEHELQARKKEYSNNERLNTRQ